MIRKHPGLFVFTMSYILAAGARALATDNREFLMYLAQMLVLIGLILWAHRRARFSAGVLWGLSIWGMLHMAGGLVPVPVERAQTDPGAESAVLYSLWLIGPDRFKYDNLVHAYGFFMATMACWQAMRRYLGQRARPGLAFAVILASAGMGLGSVNEIIEFIASELFPDNNVGGYRNNSIDLIYNAIGAAAASAFVWLRYANSFPSWVPNKPGR